MNLPEGVHYRANGKVLCGTGGDCLIQVPAGYSHNKVVIQHGLVPYLSGDWCDWAALHASVLGAGAPQSAPAFAAAWDGAFRIEVVPEIYRVDLNGERLHPFLFASRVDRFPAKAPVSPVERIYEFQTFGMAAIDSANGFLDLWLAKPGDKVLMPARAYCALYGLGETLITLELGCADPLPEPDGEWMRCLEESGPPLLAWCDREQVVFVLNRLHVNSQAHRFGVRLAAKPAAEIRSVRVSRATRSALAPFLHRELTANLDLVARFHSLGLRIHQASPEAILPDDPLRPEKFSTPIYFSGLFKDEPATGSLLRSYLCGDASKSKSSAKSWQGDFKKKLEKKLSAARRLVDLKPDDGLAFTIVIEGTGKWTERVYMPAVHAIAKNAARKISVFYANDETWASAPTWLDPPRVRGRKGEKWLTEHYLNKSNPDHRRLYDRLRDLDAVFIVTPDVTHVEIAKHWLGKTPVIFVEKPFDTEADRFRDLLYSMALSEVDGDYKTAVVGIDHYLMRLTPLLNYLDTLLAALGGGLAGVAFEMTEENPIEPGRERTLSLGLGMDLLPHFASLLLLLGPLTAMDLVRVLCAIQYVPLDRSKFDNETALAGRCRIEDYGGRSLEASFCAGKSIVQPSKRFRLTGQSGNDVIVDFAQNTVDCAGVRLGSPILKSEMAYVALMSDLYARRNTILSTCLNVSDGEQVVRFLDAMWRGTQWIKRNRGLERVPQGTGICHRVSGASK